MSTPTPQTSPLPRGQHDQSGVPTSAQHVRATRTLFPRTLVISETYVMTDENGARYEWDVRLGCELAEGRNADLQDFCPAEHGITPAHIRARYPELDEGYAATDVNPCRWTLTGQVLT